MNKSKREVIRFLVDYVAYSAEYPKQTLEVLANKINAEVTFSSNLERYVVKKEDRVLFSGNFTDVLENLTIYILEN
jgi:hypothetical protein